MKKPKMVEAVVVARKPPEGKRDTRDMRSDRAADAAVKRMTTPKRPK